MNYREGKCRSSMSNPLVSVIIPVYNGAAYLAEALESVLAQDYQPLDVIVVDDGSTDRTAEIVRSYPVARYFAQTNQGHGAARNTGIAAARGELIAFLDADDLWAPQKLSMQVGYLMAHPDLGYTISHLRILIEPGVAKPAWLNERLSLEYAAAYLPSALLVRRRVLEEVGGFDVSLWCSNDSDWFFRAKDAGITMALLPDVLLYRRIHRANLSSDVPTATSDLLRVVKASIVRQRRQPSEPQ